MLSDMDIYLFDLRGYLILEGALNKNEVQALNDGLDAMLPTERDVWHGYVYSSPTSANEGVNFQQIYEAGPAFESLIDHPSWIEHVKHFVGGEGTFDYKHGPLFIDENFANIRGPGEAIGMHSGGHNGTKRTQFRYYNGRFQCGQINILIALNDIGPGDGATMVIPGSHKSNFQHPGFDKFGAGGTQSSLDNAEGAVEAHLKAGDALLFVDAISHGSARRSNEGERRIMVYRYGPSWGYFRHGYRPSQELLDRLTPERRQIVMPHVERVRDPAKIV